jgi:hypothetical protein
MRAESRARRCACALVLIVERRERDARCGG